MQSLEKKEKNTPQVPRKHVIIKALQSVEVIGQVRIAPSHLNPNSAGSNRHVAWETAPFRPTCCHALHLQGQCGVQPNH